MIDPASMRPIDLTGGRPTEDYVSLMRGRMDRNDCGHLLAEMEGDEREGTYHCAACLREAEIAARARAEEREACAGLAGDLQGALGITDPSPAQWDLAARIQAALRARPQTPESP